MKRRITPPFFFCFRRPTNGDDWRAEPSKSRTKRHFGQRQQIVSVPSTRRIRSDHHVHAGRTRHSCQHGANGPDRVQQTPQKVTEHRNVF